MIQMVISSSSTIRARLHPDVPIAIELTTSMSVMTVLPGHYFPRFAEAGRTYLYRMKNDGTQKAKVSTEPNLLLRGVLRTSGS